MTTLETLDPNYVIVFPDEGKNEADLVSILQNNGLHSITKPGSTNGTCYMFTKITTVRKYIKIDSVLNNLSFVTKHYPFFDNEKSKQWDNLYSLLNPGKFAFPTPKSYQLQSMAEISRNPKLALYFEFFNHYNEYLKTLSIVGIFFWFISSKSNPDEFNKYYTVTSIFCSLVFLTSWIFSKQNKVITRLNQYVVDIPRNFNKKDARSVLIKKLLFVPISAGFVIALVTFQLFCFSIEIYINQIYSGPFGSILSLIPTILISVFIPILTIIYNKFFINKYVNMENGSHSGKSILEKNFILLFFSNYMPLLITLMLYLPFGHLVNNERIMALSTLGLPINTKSLYLSINTSRHQSQFFYFIFTNQIIALLTKYILPIILKKLSDKRAQKNNKNKTNRELTLQNEYPRDYKFWKKAEIIDVKVGEPFDVDEGYQKLILQFGFIAMFSSIWPLAPLIIYLINQLVLKADLWKCFKQSRPAVLPIGTNTNKTAIDMKPWDDILKLLTWISVIISSIITYMYQTNYLRGVGHATELEKRDEWYAYNPLSKSWTSILLFGILVEHVCMFVYMMLKKYMLEYDDVSSGRCYGVVPEMAVDDCVNLGKEVGPSETVETISGMKFEQGYKPLGDDDIKSRQRKGDTDKRQRGQEISDQIDNRESDGAKEEEEEKIALDNAASDKGKGTTYDDKSNFALSDSDVAGATLPSIIPTSMNYHLRFDSNGDQLCSTDVLDKVHNPPMQAVHTPMQEKGAHNPMQVKGNAPLTAVSPTPVTLKTPPIITVDGDEDETNNDKGSDDSLDTKENTYASNKSLKSARMDNNEEEEEEDSNNNKKYSKSNASVHSKHKSILSTASHKISQTRKSISSSTHPNKSLSEDDKTKSKKKKKGLFGKLKI